MIDDRQNISHGICGGRDIADGACDCAGNGFEIPAAFVDREVLTTAA